MTTTNLLQIIAVLLTGLVAGLLYGYDCSVIGGLGALPDKAYLSAFQSINKVIQNPYFFVSFMGSNVVLPASTWATYKTGMSSSYYFLLAAAIVYITGVFSTTMFGNVPLNNSLAQVNLADMTAESLLILRQKFESSWNNLHHIRTYAAILSFLLTILSILKKS